MNILIFTPEECVTKQKAALYIWLIATKQRHHFVNKGLYNQSYDFSHSHVWN